MIIIDTSAWINYFNGRETDNVKKLVELITNNEQIYITDIIVTEVLQGIKDDRKYNIVKNILLSLDFAHAKNVQTYIHAGEIYRKCRKNGITIRKTIDCIIAAIAIENGLDLLSEDSDFVNMAGIIELRLR